MKHQFEPFWWSWFSAGGTLTALVLPVVMIIFGISVPFGWIDDPEYDKLKSLIAPVSSRILIFICISLSLLHWAHRFRFTLYDGLQLQHLNRSLAILCYGSAILISLFAGYVLWNF
jgi:fumarate reductase subunit D